MSDDPGGSQGLGNGRKEGQRGMATQDTYLLHIYRSRAVSGWQWAARLEPVGGGASRHFTDRELLLAHLRQIVQAGDPSDQPGDVGEEQRTDE
jgi:hypothetical protein